jgi:hypothetical protein
MKRAPRGHDQAKRWLAFQSSGIVRIDFRPVLHICALHAHRARPLRFFFLYRVDNRIHGYSTRTAPFRSSAEVLANYRTPSRIQFGKTCGLTSPRRNAVEKIPWHGLLTSVQPRIRLGRSFDQRSHTYLGYALRVRGNIGSEVREFLVGVGEGAHAKHQFQVSDTVSGEALPVADPRLETVEVNPVLPLAPVPTPVAVLVSQRRRMLLVS